MVKKPDTNKARLNRHKRVRGKVSGTAACLLYTSDAADD